MTTATRPNQSGRYSRYLTPDEAADEYPLTKRHLKYLRQTRRLPFIKAGHRSVFFDRRDIERFLDARRIEAIGQGVS